MKEKNITAEGLQPEKSYDTSLSFVRFVAMLLVIICHIQLYFGSYLAWWFNVGVQMFFFLSGYLAGGKEISDGFSYVKKRLLRLLLDYYVCVFSCIIIDLILAPEVLSISGIVKLLLLQEWTEGLGHFWYVPVICFMSIITPLLQRGLNEGEKFIARSRLPQFVAGAFVFGIFLLLFVWIGLFLSDMSFSRTLVYFLGCVAGRCKDRWKKPAAFLSISLALVGVPLCMWHERGEAIRFFADHSVFYQDVFYPLVHDALGIALFILLYEMENHFGLFRRMERLRKFSDRYSYEIYLCHSIWIMAPIALLSGKYGGSVFGKGMLQIQIPQIQIPVVLAWIFTAFIIVLHSVLVFWISRKIRSSFGLKAA